MKGKKAVALLIAAAMVLGTAACSNGDGTSETTQAASSGTEVGSAAETTASVSSDQKRQVNIEISGDPQSLAPYVALSTPRNRTIIYNIYEPLFFRLEFGGELTSCLAKSYELMDGNVYRITLYDSIKDSAGNPITSSDVVFSYDKCREIGVNPSQVSYIDKIEIVDDYTFDMYINSTEVGAFAECVLWTPIIAEAAWNASPDEMISTPVATGPYVLDEWIAGSSLTLVKNENYWQTVEEGGERQAVDKIHYSEIAESAQVTIALETGEVDFAYDLQSSDMFRFDGSGNVQGYALYTVLDNLIQTVFFNCSEGNPCSDPVVRQAISYAIDADAILNNLFNGEGETAVAFSNSRYSDFVDSWQSEEYYLYNPDLAKEMLASVGYADGLQLRIMTNSSANHKRIAEIIQAQLGEIGVGVEILNYENALFNTYVLDETQFDMYVAQKAAGGLTVSIWNMSLDADTYGGTTRNFLDDAQLQKLLDTAMESATSTPENVDACWQRIKELNPVYALCTGMKKYVHAATITEPLVSGESVFYPGMSTYSADHARIAE